MTKVDYDALALEVMDSIEPRYQHDITVFAKAYRAALAEKMEHVGWVGDGGLSVTLSDMKGVYDYAPLYSLEGWKK